MEAPTPDDWPRIADLVKQYGDFPFGGVDASIVVLAERLAIERTLEHMGYLRQQIGGWC